MIEKKIEPDEIIVKKKDESIRIIAEDYGQPQTSCAIPFRCWFTLGKNAYLFYAEFDRH